MDLLKETQTSLRHRVRVLFYNVFADKRGKKVLKQLGLIRSKRPSTDDTKTLHGLRFQIGDFIAATVYEEKY